MKMTFKEFRRKVSVKVESKLGLGLSDLPDMDISDLYPGEIDMDESRWKKAIQDAAEEVAEYQAEEAGFDYDDFM